MTDLIYNLGMVGSKSDNLRELLHTCDHVYCVGVTCSGCAYGSENLKDSSYEELLNLFYKRLEKIGELSDE